MNRRGFITTTTAMALLALVGVAAAQLTTAFSTDVRRTENEKIDAQLRQILIAGILQSRQNGAIQLPDPLKDVKLEIQGKTITAQMDRHHQQITLPD
jgi:type II secretory pathway component PulK